jgi:uncharacterized protein
MQGFGLLGEVPAYLGTVPFPTASMAVLRAFSRLTGIPVDLSELKEYGRTVRRHLNELIDKVNMAATKDVDDTPTATIEPPDEEAQVREAQQRRIGEMFREAMEDRSKSGELKRELDRLELFHKYEDRFLDLFKGD